jgi:hypothetical protein
VEARREATGDALGLGPRGGGDIALSRELGEPRKRREARLALADLAVFFRLILRLLPFISSPPPHGYVLVSQCASECEESRAGLSVFKASFWRPSYGIALECYPARIETLKNDV